MDDQILLTQLRDLREQAVAFAVQHSDAESVNPMHRASAHNLLHYLALRRHELRAVQLGLIERGLSSLGILESHTLATLNSVIAALECLQGQTPTPAPFAPVNVADSTARLERASNALFGNSLAHRDVRIMVTMPTEAADSHEFLSRLLEAGMNVMRINCAHDNADTWQQMIGNLRLAEASTGKTCKIQLDLAGPKLRTGTIRSVGRVMKLKPVRDVFGHVYMPGRFWLIPEGEDAVAANLPTLEVSGKVLAETQPGDGILLTDAREASRELRIVAKHQHARLVTTEDTIYLQENTSLQFERHGVKLGRGTLVNVHEVVPPLVLHIGDQLLLTRDAAPGMPAEHDADGVQIQPARIHCTLADAFDAVQTGQQVWLDDGKIGGTVETSDGDTLGLRITHTPPGGAKLRSEKGINFPDTVFHTLALTDKDITDLEAMAGKVDMVALSFVRTPQDVADLQAHLQRLSIPDTGIVLKIENRSDSEPSPLIHGSMS